MNGCKQIVQNQYKFDLPQSHTCGAPRESSKLDLSVPQIKVMWKLCCQTGWPIFSLHGMFSFFLFCSHSLLLSPSVSAPTLSVFPIFLLFLFPFLLFSFAKKKNTLHLFGQVCGDEMTIPLVESTAQTRAVHPGGWWAMLILFWEHVAVVIASALPLPSTCHLVGGRPLLRTVLKDNGHALGSSVSCWGWRGNAVCIFCDL